MPAPTPSPVDQARPLRVVIVDDEAPARRGMRHLLAREADMEIAAECAAGDEAVATIENERPDIVLLDVQMPGLDGFGVLRALQMRPMPLVVFVTAYDTHAIAAFAAAAVDYLLKPVTEMRFQAALTRVRERLQERRAARDEHTLRALLAAQPPAPSTARLERLLVRLGKRTELLPVESIDWMEAAGDYVQVHAGHRVHLVSATLTALLGQVDPALFVRIHRARVVNLARVRALRRQAHGEYVLDLESGVALTAGRSYTKALGDTFRAGRRPPPGAG